MRLVTRGDLDGLTCAVIIALNEQVDAVSLIHPQDITEGRFGVGPDDILANLPYHPACGLWFDHHMHTATPAAPPPSFRGAFGEAIWAPQRSLTTTGRAATETRQRNFLVVRGSAARTGRPDSGPHSGPPIRS